MVFDYVKLKSIGINIVIWKVRLIIFASESLNWTRKPYFIRFGRKITRELRSPNAVNCIRWGIFNGRKYCSITGNMQTRQTIWCFDLSRWVPRNWIFRRKRKVKFLKDSNNSIFIATVEVSSELRTTGLDMRSLILLCFLTISDGKK